MPVGGGAATSAQQRRQRIARDGSEHAIARVALAARPVDFARVDSGKPDPAAVGTGDRPAAIPNQNSIAGKRDGIRRSGGRVRIVRATLQMWRKFVRVAARINPTPLFPFH